MRQRCSSSESVLTYVAVAFRGGTLLINQRCLRSAVTGTLWNRFFLGQELLDSTPKTRKYLDDSYPEIEICSSILRMSTNCPVALMCPLLEFNLVFHINHLSSSLPTLYCSQFDKIQDLWSQQLLVVSVNVTCSYIIQLIVSGIGSLEKVILSVSKEEDLSRPHFMMH